jgi:hypothetical protein
MSIAIRLPHSMYSKPAPELLVVRQPGLVGRL